MSSGVGGGISGGGGAARGGGRGGNRKNSKKFGKNLNNLIKAPAAPPVPVVSSGNEGGSTSSFRGSSSSRNGLLLLSTKSKYSSSTGGGGGGLLASHGTPKTAHDALLLSAGAGGQDGGGDLEPKTAPTPAWGMGQKKQATPVPEKKVVEQTNPREVGHEKPALVSSRVSSLPRKKPLPSLPAVNEIVGKVETIELERASPKKISNMSPLDSQPINKPNTGAIQPEVSTPNDNPVAVTNQVSHKPEKFKDDQVEYMSKLAKERAEKLRLEEEARMTAQKERAAKRLRELEEKRREAEKKRMEEMKKQQQVKSQAQSQTRKELSKPQVILEPLGKCKKDVENGSSPISKTSSTEKKDGRNLYDPDCPYSSLVGGKTVKEVIDNAMKQDGRPPGNTPAVETAAPSGQQSNEQTSNDGNKKDTPQSSVQMVQLSNLDELERGGRGGGQGGPRMLFDPSSGSMVKVSSKEEPKTKKNSKQNKGTSKSSQRCDEVNEIISFRPMDGGGASEKNPEAKPLRSKQGKVGRKDEPISLQAKNKKSSDTKSRPTGQYQIRRKRFPRTCGVRYKMDKNGNYVNVDGCQPDNGYGAHRAPGGKVKNPSAYAKFLKQQEEKHPTSQQSNNNVTMATEGFSFRNDPGFLQHQTDFEAQQQKILEDAWASLVENDEPPEKRESMKDELKEEVPVSKPLDEEYSTALAIGPSMIRLNFDSNENIDSVLSPSTIKASANTATEEPIDLAKFALEAASSSVSAATPANPFTSLGVSGASLWGAGTPNITGSSYGDLGALTGWDATATPSAGMAASAGLDSSHASKLGLWGSSSALDASDDSVLRAFSEAPKD